MKTYNYELCIALYESNLLHTQSVYESFLYSDPITIFMDHIHH